MQGDNMSADASGCLTDVIGHFPYRMALADRWYMHRAGMATGTREIALARWGRLPDGDPAERVRELYEAENRDRAEPSGSQDMIGLIYPGVNRLDFRFDHQGGIFPAHIESNNDADVIDWLQQVIHIVPIAQRPDGYNPLGVKNLDPDWIERLGATGKRCFDSIVRRDLAGLGQAMNECMLCWAAILPHTVAHPTICTDLEGILKYYQSRHAGAMYSGCGGGYLYVVSDQPVPGGFQPRVRAADSD
jgi:hypothetical protein